MSDEDIYGDIWADGYLEETKTFYTQRADGVLLESRDTLGYMKFAWNALEAEKMRAEKYLLPKSKLPIMDILTVG